jgi:hypothetical protein
MGVPSVPARMPPNYANFGSGVLAGEWHHGPIRSGLCGGTPLLLLRWRRERGSRWRGLNWGWRHRPIHGPGQRPVGWPSTPLRRKRLQRRHHRVGHQLAALIRFELDRLRYVAVQHECHRLGGGRHRHCARCGARLALHSARFRAWRLGFELQRLRGWRPWLERQPIRQIRGKRIARASGERKRHGYRADSE